MAQTYPLRIPDGVGAMGRTNGYATASLVFAALGGFLPAIILGCVGLSQVNRSGQRGRGTAQLGILIGPIELIAVVVVIVVTAVS